MFQQILHGYKASIPPEQWEQFFGSLHENVQLRLRERYAM